MNAPVPEGFALFPTHTGFIAHVGPFYYKKGARPMVIGVRIDERHQNIRGIVRLRDLYKLLVAAGTKRLDASQDAWLAGAEQACPDQINDEGSIAIEASACRAARYVQRSALLDQVIAGCRAGKCPLDKL